MKSKLHLQSLAAILFLIVSLSTAPAQKGPGAPPAVDPNTGLPLPQARTLPAMDPVTGLPQSQPTPWKDPNWKDPDIVLTNVFYDGLPLSEVVRHLQDQFKGYFDVLTPVNPDWDTDWQSIAIRLQLKNVTASEVFNAMNLVFESDRTPLRWELKLNGKRPTALLRVLAQPSPKNPPPVIDPTTGLPVSPESKRGVYFVGNLLGDEKSGGMTMEQLVQTLSEVHQMSFGSQGGLQFHKQAQLVIVTGTDTEIEFIGNTLTALRQKEELDAVRKAQSKSAESKPKSEATKTP
jgi:hypothetical protein